MSFNVSPSPVVAGASTSTNQAVARWDGTAGTTLQNSAVIIGDDGDLTTPAALRVLSNDLTHYCELLAAAGMSVNVTIRLPATPGAPGQSLLLGGDASTLSWFTPFTSLSFEAYATALPMKASAQAASTANIDMGAGNPGSIDGVDLIFGGTVLLKDQTDATENGLWLVDSAGVWTRDPTMPDDGFSAVSAIVAVNDGGIINGNTIWYSLATGADPGPVPFRQIATAATPMAVVSLTTTQRDALSGVANGQMIYNTTTNKFQGRAAGAWADLN